MLTPFCVTFLQWILVKGCYQVACTETVKSDRKSDTDYTCKLHNETLLALALLTPCHGKAKANAAE